MRSWHLILVGVLLIYGGVLIRTLGVDRPIVPPTPRPTATARVVPPFSIGTGVADRMAERGDVPASDELYIPAAPAGRGQMSLTVGRSGALYVYAFDTDWTEVLGP
jgi:hypothetical protein